MNRKSLIKSIVFFLIVVSCNKKQNRYYPNKETFITNQKLYKIEYHNLDFRKISKIIDKKLSNDSLSYVKLIDNNIEYNMLIDNTSFHAKRKSVLTVTKDSVLVDDSYDISKLGNLMLRHYTNNGKNPKYPNNHKAAFIELSLAQQSEDFEETLLNIVTVFDSINAKIQDSLELKILLKRKMPPPPPPPPKR